MSASCCMPILTKGKVKKSLWSPTLIRGFQAGLTPTRLTVFNRLYPTEWISRLLAALEPILLHREQLHSHPLPGAPAEQHRQGYRCYRRQLQHCVPFRSEEHTSELKSLMRISYAVFCLKKKNIHTGTASPCCTIHTYR